MCVRVWREVVRAVSQHVRGSARLSSVTRGPWGIWLVQKWRQVARRTPRLYLHDRTDEKKKQKKKRKRSLPIPRPQATGGPSNTTEERVHAREIEAEIKTLVLHLRRVSRSVSTEEKRRRARYEAGRGEHSPDLPNPTRHRRPHRQRSCRSSPYPPLHLHPCRCYP